MAWFRAKVVRMCGGDFHNKTYKHVIAITVGSAALV
jgi:hypothetical protein